MSKTRISDMRKHDHTDILHDFEHDNNKDRVSMSLNLVRHMRRKQAFSSITTNNLSE